MSFCAFQLCSLLREGGDRITAKVTLILATLVAALGAIRAYWLIQKCSGNAPPKDCLQPLPEMPPMNPTSLLV